VHSLLHRGDVTQIAGASAATGGIGSTWLGWCWQVATRRVYALRFGAAYPGGIFWLRAHGTDDAKSRFAPEGWEAEGISQVQALAGWLGSARGACPQRK
jgi:hypothetical protein